MPKPTFSKLSILMAAYNEEDSLRLCVEAVLAVLSPQGLKREIDHRERRQHRPHLD